MRHVKKIIFIILFFIMILIGKNINFSQLIGEPNQFFTLFQFFGPIAGFFLGPIYGAATILLALLADLLILGKTFSLINLLRLLPMLFAAYYFGTKNRTVSVIVPLICMTLFMMHPVGREVWFFSLYWLIPVVAALLPKRVPGQVVWRSYGATFTAHAVGGAIWIYTVPMTAAQWISLIPIVAYERFLFGLGIIASYAIFNILLNYIVDKWKIKLPVKALNLDQRFSLFRNAKG